MLGKKLVENRTWDTAYRGPLAIHAGKSRKWLPANDPGGAYNYGVVVAITSLVACLPISTVNALPDSHIFAWVKEHQYTEGPYCWVFGPVEKISPQTAKGKQGLWEWTEK